MNRPTPPKKSKYDFRSPEAALAFLATDKHHHVKVLNVTVGENLPVRRGRRGRSNGEPSTAEQKLSAAMNHLLENVDEVVAQFSKHKLLCRVCVDRFNGEGLDDFEEILIGFLPLLNTPLGREMISGQEDQRECIVCEGDCTRIAQHYDECFGDDGDDYEDDQE